MRSKKQKVLLWFEFRLYVFSLITYLFRNKPGTQNDTRMLFIIMNLRGGNERIAEIYTEHGNTVSGEG